jgi:hypothetical protein
MLTHKDVLSLVQESDHIMALLKTIQKSDLNDAWISAGTIRNLIWDKLEGKTEPTPMNDIDVIYYDPQHQTKEHERAWDAHLTTLLDMPWECKNQARMHEKHGFEPATSVAEGMSRWVYKSCAIAARLTDEGEIELMSPFEDWLECTASHMLHATPVMLENNPELPKVHYINKGWDKKWPTLKLA